MPGIIATRPREATASSVSVVNLALAAVAGIALGLTFVYLSSSGDEGAVGIQKATFKAPAVSSALLPQPPVTRPAAGRARDPPGTPAAPALKPKKKPPTPRPGPVKTGSCAASPLTRWAIRKVGKNSLQIFLAEYPQMCLVSEGTTEVGYPGMADTVELQPCSSGGAERDLFTRTPAIEGSPGSVVQLAQSMRCLDVPGPTSARGVALVLYDCHGKENQNFAFDAASGLMALPSKSSCMAASP